MEVIKRIKTLREHLKMNQVDFSHSCELGNFDITNIENGRKVLKYEIIEKIAEKYPEFRIWLLTGEEFPEAGQISPMTKEAMERNKIEA